MRALFELLLEMLDVIEGQEAELHSLDERIRAQGQTIKEYQDRERQVRTTVQERDTTAAQPGTAYRDGEASSCRR